MISVGKNVLSKDNPKEYEDVINKQVILEFCDSFIKTFSWNKEEINISFNERKEFITKLLDCLLELNEKKMLGKNFSEEDIEVFLCIIDRYDITPPSYFGGYDISGKMDLLSNIQNKKAIIETMVKDEYFTKLIEFL